MGAPELPTAVRVIDAADVAAHDDDASRRFGGVARIYGASSLGALARAHACIVGIGGVGSWAAEALARSGVGRLTLVDADHVALSNVNRQVHALESTLGAAKAEAMRSRIADISPTCVVQIVEDFVTAENVEHCVPADALLVDAIDAPRAKAALIACALRRGQPVLACGAAGGRTDPLRLRREDLARTRGDALLAAVRSRLRREHGFPRQPNARFGVEALYSDEALPDVRAASVAMAAGDAMAADEAMAAGDALRHRARAGAPLACAGYGSLVTVTATMGLAAASWAIARVVGR